MNSVFIKIMFVFYMENKWIELQDLQEYLFSFSIWSFSYAI